MCLVADGRGGDDEVEADSQQDSDKTSPSNESLGSESERVTSSSPLIGSVDGRVSIDVGTVLVLEPVDAIALQSSSALVRGDQRDRGSVSPTLPFLPWGSTHPFAFMNRERPFKFC